MAGSSGPTRASHFPVSVALKAIIGRDLRFRINPPAFWVSIWYSCIPDMPSRQGMVISSTPSRASLNYRICRISLLRTCFRELPSSHRVSCRSISPRGRAMKRGTVRIFPFSRRSFIRPRKASLRISPAIWQAIPLPSRLGYSQRVCTSDNSSRR